jgi:hypothetical protein
MTIWISPSTPGCIPSELKASVCAKTRTRTFMAAQSHQSKGRINPNVCGWLSVRTRCGKGMPQSLIQPPPKKWSTDTCYNRNPEIRLREISHTQKLHITWFHLMNYPEQVNPQERKHTCC